MATIMKTDAEIQQDVLDELDWDPEIEVTDVGVEVDDGVVTLTGTVDMYTTKLTAERAAFRVAGVRAVANDIRIQPTWSGERTDTQIAQSIANAFEWDVSIPEEQIDVRVADHWVTLSGEVDWHYQRIAAENAAKRIGEVTGVNNNLRVQQPVASASDIKEGIENALVRSAEVDSDRITVDVRDGRVTLSGTVRSWAERQEAQEAVWKARGVTSVDNKIKIRTHQAE